MATWQQNRDAALKYAEAYGWVLIDYAPSSAMLSAKRAGVRINVYLTTMTVGTALDHPKKGKTQLFRRNVTHRQLEQLFNDPRCHTGKGYYTKKAYQANKGYYAKNARRI